MSGVDVRDYFAAKAMPALLAAAMADFEQNGYPPYWMEGVSADAYRMADAMLAARVQGDQP